MNLKLFKNRNFSLFVFGQSTSLFGTIFLNVSLALYVLNITGSPAKFSSILALGVIPGLVLGPFAGAVVDKVDRKKMIIFLDGIRGIYLAVLFIVTLNSQIQLGWIYFTVMFFSLCNIFFGPAFTTILPSIVTKEELVDANALQTTILETTRVLAPFLGTLIYSIFGFGIILLIDGITYLVSAISECFMVFETQIKASGKSFGKDILDGFKIFTRDIRITSLVSNGVLTHMFLTPFIFVGFPYMIVNVFGGANVDYGIVESIASIGSILSIFVVTLMKKKYNVAQSIGIGILGMLGGVIILGVLGVPGFINLLNIHNRLPIIFFAFVSFILYISFNSYAVFFVSFYQETVPKELLGRFVSVMIMLFSIGHLIGLRMFGMMFERYNLIVPVVVLGVGMLLKLLVHIPFIQQTRKLISDNLSSN